MTAAYNNTKSVLNANDVVKVAGKGGQDSYRDVGAMQMVYQTFGKAIVVQVNGGSYTIPDNIRTYLINPAGTIAGSTVTMPANPFDGQIVSLVSTQTITTLTLQANTNQTLNGALTTIGAAASTHGSYVWDASTSTWYPL